MTEKDRLGYVKSHWKIYRFSCSTTQNFLSWSTTVANIFENFESPSKKVLTTPLENRIENGNYRAHVQRNESCSSAHLKITTWKWNCDELGFVKKIIAFYVRLICPEEIFIVFVFYLTVVYWKGFQNIYTFTYQKRITSCAFLLVLKIAESLQYILKQFITFRNPWAPTNWNVLLLPFLLRVVILLAIKSFFILKNRVIAPSVLVVADSQFGRIAHREFLIIIVFRIPTF